MLKTDTVVIAPEWLALISEIDVFTSAQRALGAEAVSVFYYRNGASGGNPHCTCDQI